VSSPFLVPERDRAFRRGRPKSATNYYTIPGAVAVSAAVQGGVTSNNYDHYAPFYVDAPITVDQLAAEVTTNTSGKNMRIGIYAADTDWQPIGAPLADSGDLSIATTGVKTYTPGTPITLPRGRYLTVQNNDDNTFNVSLQNWPSYVPGTTSWGTSLSTIYCRGWVVPRTYAAFPTPGLAWTTATTTGQPGMYVQVVLRVTAP
jgi:hypothetical protein